MPMKAKHPSLTSHTPVPEHQDCIQPSSPVLPIAGPLMQTDAHSSAEEPQVKDPIATVINTGRPKRDKRKPPQYDASTGKWI